MRSRHLVIITLLVAATLLAWAMCATPLLAQSEYLPTSLHYTKAGKIHWYSAANGGFETLTGIPIEQLGCLSCHGDVDANGNPYPDYYTGIGCYDCHTYNTGNWVNVQQSTCMKCHARQSFEAVQMGLPDVHRTAGMRCFDCHRLGDVHGDGTDYSSLLESGAIDTDCAGCHPMLPAEHAAKDPHGGKLHCAACHTASVVSCYNCHFDSQVLADVKRPLQGISDFVMLVNRDKDGKVYPATFASMTYGEKGFVAFAPYYAHAITREGRICSQCHNQATTAGGTNAAIADYNRTGAIQFARWDNIDKTLRWTHGVVPLPADYRKTFKIDFLKYDGDPAAPLGPVTQWSFLDDDWDGAQMLYASPLTRQQMDTLGFATMVAFDLKQTSIGANKMGLVSAVVFGGAGLDVQSIDQASLRLAGAVPISLSLADAGAPVESVETCAASTTVADGWMDLVLKFRVRDVQPMPGPFVRGEQTTVALTGMFKSGAPLVGADCVIVRGGGQMAAAAHRAVRAGGAGGGR